MKVEPGIYGSDQAKAWNRLVLRKAAMVAGCLCVGILISSPFLGTGAKSELYACLFAATGSFTMALQFVILAKGGR